MIPKYFISFLHGFKYFQLYHWKWMIPHSLSCNSSWNMDASPKASYSIPLIIFLSATKWLWDSSPAQLVYLCVYECMCTCRHMYIHVHVKTRGQPQLSTPWSSPPWFLKQNVSLIWGPLTRLCWPTMSPCDLAVSASPVQSPHLTF